MKIPGRQITKNMVLLEAAPGRNAQETQIDYIDPPTPFIAVMPKARSIYPLRELNQMNVYFGVIAMPADATFVNFTLVKFRGWIIPPDASSFDAGCFATGTARYEIFAEQVLIYNSVTGFFDPVPQTVQITGPTPTLAYNSQTYNYFGGAPGQGGGSFSFPITEDYVGLLVESDDDGEGAPGTYVINTTLGNS